MDNTRLDPSSAREPRGDAETSLSVENVAATNKAAQVAPPPSRGVRKLVLCFDGTGNKFQGDDSDSNILKIFRMLDRTADDQYHYYQPGIGTYVVSGSLSHTSVRARINSWYQKAKDSAVGSSFDQHVVGGYRFLMRFYNPGDEIYMFGFSRGSYIARFLAEMLDHIGLLSHGNEEMVKFAWKAFAQWQCRQQSAGSDEEKTAADEQKDKMFRFMKGFRETFSRPVGRIKFLGLFDTVNSVPRFETAWMQRSKFPYTARSSAKVIRHAVSIDERRAKFRQDLMYQGNPKIRHHRHRHLGDWLGRDSWYPHHHRHSRPEKAETGKIEEKQDDGGQQQQQQQQQQGDDGPSDVRSSEDRGRPQSKFLTPQGGGERSAQGASKNQSARYRVRSASRRRQPVSQQLQQKQLAQLQTGYPQSSDGMSEASGISPSEIDPDWDDDGQDIDEVWFAGGHADIGGGWEVLGDRKSASHVPLAWMVREAMRAGLPFDSEKVAEMGCACAVEWDGINPAKRPGHIKRRQKKKQSAANIPDIRLANGCQPTFPSDSPPATQQEDSVVPDEKASRSRRDSSSSSSSDPDSDEQEKSFHSLMGLAHTARIHDSLEYGAGLGFIAVSAWKFMEYLPFRRMDLKFDGSWEPIRWPLPRGEVRDVPDNVRIHGSVIRRMQADENYRPGNLIIGGGGRGMRKAPAEYGIGDWVCVADEGDAIGEIWVRKGEPPGAKEEEERRRKKEEEKEKKQKKNKQKKE